MKVPCAKLIPVFITACLLAAPVQAFDIEQAAAIEGLFRGIAVRCGTPEFASNFIAASKKQVAIAVEAQEIGPAVKDVEAKIIGYSEHPDVQAIPMSECEALISQLEHLHVNREKALHSAKEVVKELSPQ